MKEDNPMAWSVSSKLLCTFSLGNTCLLACISSNSDDPFHKQISSFREAMERNLYPVFEVDLLFILWNTPILRLDSVSRPTSALCKHWSLALDASFSCNSTQIISDSRLFRLYILFSQYRSCDDTQEI